MLFHDPRFPSLVAIAYPAAIINTDLCYEAINQKMAFLLGGIEGDYRGNPVAHETLRTCAIEAFRAHKRGRRPEPSYSVIKGIYYEVQAQALRLPEKQDLILIGVIDRNTQLESRLRKICDRIVSTMAPQNAYASLITAICHDLSWSFADLWLPNPEQTHLYLGDLYFAGSPDLEKFYYSSREILIPLDDLSWLASLAWNNNKYHHVDDISKSLYRLPTKNRNNLKSAIAFPLSGKDKKFGVFTFYSSVVGGCSVELLHIVESAIFQLAGLIEREENAKTYNDYLLTLGAILERLRSAIASQNLELCEKIALELEEALNDLSKLK